MLQGVLKKGTFSCNVDHCVFLHYHGANFLCSITSKKGAIVRTKSVYCFFTSFNTKIMTVVYNCRSFKDESAVQHLFKNISGNTKADLEI